LFEFAHFSGPVFSTVRSSKTRLLSTARASTGPAPSSVRLSRTWPASL
jgi:hypothetical protein